MENSPSQHSDWTKPRSPVLNGGVVKLTASRGQPPPAETSGAAFEKPPLERFDTAPEGTFEPSTTTSQPPRADLNRTDTSAFSTYSTVSRATIPPPGSVLTGKQEHCTYTWRITGVILQSSHTDAWQISNENLSPSKQNGRSQSSRVRLLFSDLARPSGQTLVK